MGEVINIDGNSNVINTGYIVGNLVTQDKYIIVNCNIMDNNKILEKMGDTVDALNNISKSQLLLSEAILKHRENDCKQSDALIILARAAENNSLANLNVSQALLRDKELLNCNLIERIVNILEQHLNTDK